MNIVLYRLFNKIETSELIGWVNFGDYNEQEIREKLQRAEPGYVYYTNAFFTSGMRRCFKYKYPDESFGPMRVLKECYDSRYKIVRGIRRAKTPMDVIRTLTSIDGIGNFLSYQMFVDFTFLEEFPWSENEFVVSGPGCIAGLNLLFDDPDGLTHDELLFWLRDHCPITEEECFTLLSDLPEWDRRMNIMSLENCMCELSKYIRAAEGTGRPKNKYHYGG